VIDVESDINYITHNTLKFYFNGSACKDGQGIALLTFLLMVPFFEVSSRLDYNCTNNQAEYEALIFGLLSIEERYVVAFDDSLFVQQVMGLFKCLEGSLDVYLDNCLTLLCTLPNSKFDMSQGMRNNKTNMLVQ
jgi:ribonuclease HI